MKFIYWKSDNDGQWYWHLRASNGKIIAQGEGYRRKRDLLHTIARIQKCCVAQKFTVAEK
jgi:uncharacterized protein YegP (UPF0339 family)